MRGLAGVAVMAMAIAGCQGGGDRPPEAVPIAGVRFTDVAEVGRYLGMAVARDPVSQALILTDGTNRVEVTPGTALAVVNGQFVDVGRPARFHGGRLAMPAAGVPRITAQLRPRPARRGAE